MIPVVGRLDVLLCSLGLDRSNSRDQPSVVPHLRWHVHSIGLRLQTQFEHRLSSVHRREFQLLIAHLSKFFCFHIHNNRLRPCMFDAPAIPFNSKNVHYG